MGHELKIFKKGLRLNILIQKSINSTGFMNFIRTKIYLLIILIVVLLPAYTKAQISGEDEYASTIMQADTYFKNGDYINAKTSYQYAARLKPDEQYPKDRLRATVDKLREKMALMEQYTSLITEADEFYRNDEFDKAIAKYEEAGKLVPSEGYPAEKIAGIKEQKAEKRKLQVAYDDAIYRAEKYEKYRKFEEARTEYEKAHEVFPDETLPSEKIEELSVMIEEVSKARAKYNEIIADADRLFSLKYYENAKQEYQKALDAKPDETYPQAKMKEIDGLLVKKNEFDQLVSDGDEFYMNKNLEEAKSKYQAALKIYPSENYPKDMLDKINTAMVTSKGPDEMYAESIAQGDQFLVAKDYVNALKEYQNASEIRPSESYPKEKITEINNTMSAAEAGEASYQLAVKMGDQYFKANDLENAKDQYEQALSLKPESAYPSERLALVEKALQEQSALKANYDGAIAKADAFFEKKDFELARSEYQVALSIIPGDTYATAQLEKIDKKERDLKEMGEQYAGLIADADEAFESGNYQEARQKFATALEMDNTQSYPKDKMAEIDNILAKQSQIENAYARAIASADLFFEKEEYYKALNNYELADSLKPATPYAQKKIADINEIFQRKADRDNAYIETLKEAEGLLAMQKYEDAKLAFMKAGNMKPEESLPRNKIDEIDSLIAARDANKAEYNKLVDAADRMMEAKDYTKAKERYLEALNILPGMEYPSQKLKEIDEIVLAAELEVQNTYNALITEADTLLAQNAYEQARLKYKEAQKYKPDEVYPGQKLAEIEHAVNDLEKLQAKYSKLVNEGDRLFSMKDYQDAREKYREASNLFPEEVHPKEKLEEINLFFKAEAEKTQEAYDKAIAEADKFLAGKEYDQAMAAYRKASAYMPDENYPQTMIDKILAILAVNAQRKIVTSPVTIINNEQEKFSFDPVAASDRKASILHIRARGMAVKDFKVTVGYGKGGSKNGGYVLPIPANSESGEFIIPLGNQYTWYSEDNNWFTLTPQGGSVEVELLEITRGD